MHTKLSRRNAARLCAAAICGATFLRLPAAHAQTAPTQSAPAQSTPQFDVSTVKTSVAATGDSSGISTHPGLVDARNVTLQRCIVGAYSVGPHQVIGGPDWVYTDRFDIMAKPDHPIDNDDLLNQMLQNLLADRFKLALHHESKKLPAYVLEVDKRGPKMDKADGSGDSNTDTSTGRRGRTKITATNTDMNELAQMLARKMDLPVVNQTNLPGIFNFTLHWIPDSISASEQNADDVSIFTAVQEQLGLHLRSAKAPVEVLVIDHAEKPSEN